MFTKTCYQGTTHVVKKWNPQQKDIQKRHANKISWSGKLRLEWSLFYVKKKIFFTNGSNYYN